MKILAGILILLLLYSESRIAIEIFIKNIKMRRATGIADWGILIFMATVGGIVAAKLSFIIY